ncbi:MAG: type IV pilus secretin PilQ, partial [Caldimonas sp.]
LGHLPVVGRLFGNNSGEGKKTEIILSITPRIIRPPAFVDASLREVFSGTESSIRQRALQLDPVGSVRAQSTGGPAPAAAPGAARPAPAAPPATQPAPPPATAPARPPATAPARPTAAPPAATTSAAGAAGSTPPAGAAEYLRNLQPYLENRFAKPNAAGAPAPAVPQPAPATGDPAAPAPEAPARDAKGSP